MFSQTRLENTHKVIEVPVFPIPRNQAPGGAWYLPWHKFGVWTLTQYDVAIYMDADMLALKDTRELFRHLDGPVRGQWGGAS